jgi:drug/metabolite transporter (DMT)-like permease
MQEAVLLALAASFFTATASVCQRLGARATEDTSGFDLEILLRLVREPIWLLGFASQILGFVFQIIALRHADLALVQPILATELLFVFAYMSVIGSRGPRRRDWFAVVAMAAGLGLFLFSASPSGGHLHAPFRSWLLAGLAVLVAEVILVGVAYGWGGRSPGPSSRRAALLGAATGIGWGFVAAVIKELSSHLGQGIGAIVSNWSLYVLIVAGAATVLLAQHALSAGPLAASQPGFTILDPIVAAILGVLIFDEHLRVTLLSLAGEAAALALLISGVTVLSHSQLVAPGAPLEDCPPKRRPGPRSGVRTSP